MRAIGIVRMVFLLVVLSAIGTAVSGADPNDREGSKDPPVFTRMPGFYIYRSEEVDFDRHEFRIGPGKAEAVEGRRHNANYYANEGITLPSGLQVVRNYVNAAKAIGGQEVYAFEDGGTEYTTLKVVRDDAEIWTEVSAASNGMYAVTMIWKELMKQDVTANADVWAGSIRETGKAAVYGIYFDTGKSDLKPESEAALSEIAKLLQADANLKLHVVGHTDSVGSLADNLKLSQNRAAAVVRALTANHGVSAGRLTGNGVGPLAPVSPNDTDAGRAKNRRVELVKQ